MASSQWNFCNATASKPAASPIVAKDGVSRASASRVVSGRGCSSTVRMSSPLPSRTGTTERAKYPPAIALAARSCDRSA